MSIQFSIAPINWTNDDDPSLGGDISLETCLSEMKEAGYVGCEMGNKFPKNIDALKEILAKYNLQLTSEWISTFFTDKNCFQKSVDQFGEHVEFLKHFNVQALKVCECARAIQQSELAIFDHQIHFDDQEWQRLITGLETIGKIACENKMFVAYHHHLGTGVQDESQIDHLMENSCEKLVTLLPDTGHLLAAGVDPLPVFDRYASRIKYVHLKDVRENIWQTAKKESWSFMQAVREGLFTVPSDGCIEFAPIFESLKKNNYQGWLVVEAEQDPKKAEPFLYAQKARRFLQKYFS